VLLEALTIADAADDLDAQARALSALVSVYTYRGEYAEARIAVVRLRHVADRIGEPTIAIVADRVMGTTLVAAGRLREARESLERVVRSPAISDDQRRSTWNHSEHRAMARAMLARALWQQGFIDRAHAEARQSLADLDGSDHDVSLCRVLYYGICRITPMTGDFATAERSIARLIEVATSLNVAIWQTAGHFLAAKLLVERREFAIGLAMLEEAFAICRRTGWRLSYPEFKGAQALALAGLGRHAEALEAVDEAIAAAGERTDGQLWYVPELLRIKGDVLLQQGGDRSAAAAEDCYGQAGEMAREHGAVFWELRIALSLAHLRTAQGRGVEARQIVAPIYERFTEGFDTADLRQARTMLDQEAV
jgi:tetratricopeptide (TPR) repeat protein